MLVHPVYTLWKLLPEEAMTKITGKKNRSQSQPLSLPMEAPKQHFVTHIEYRRLWGLADGRIRVEKREQGHLHGCRVCQGVLYAYLDQPTTTSSDTPPESESDAA